MSLFDETDHEAMKAVAGIVGAMSRASDPETSKDAAAHYAASGKLSGDAGIVLGILKRIGKPSTDMEIWAAATEEEKARMQYADIPRKRLYNPLFEKGIVRKLPARKCLVNGASKLCWEVV